MSAVTATQGANQISPASERVYHQSNLLGDWKGTWAKNHQTVELKVVNIKGNTAQVEYTHNGHTERGAASVNGSTITYGNVTIGTRDSKLAAIEFAFGNTKMNGVLAKSAAGSGQAGWNMDWHLAYDRTDRSCAGPGDQWEGCAGQIYCKWLHPAGRWHRLQKHCHGRQSAGFVR